MPIRLNLLLFNVSSKPIIPSIVTVLFVSFSIYHLFTRMANSKLMKFIHSHYGLDALSSKFNAEMVNSKSQSAFSSDDIVTTELNKTPIDTRVCLLPESPSELVSGLTNTGNSCFLNSILQVNSQWLSLFILTLLPGTIIITSTSIVFRKVYPIITVIQLTCYAIIIKNASPSIDSRWWYY